MYPMAHRRRSWRGNRSSRPAAASCRYCPSASSLSRLYRLAGRPPGLGADGPVSRTFPDASIVVVGRVKSPVDEPWWDACSRFLSRPNVHALGWRSQESLAGYYQAFDVTLIPYRMDHPFNRACNPTKIMDAMGSGRPIVATAIPECRLHAERFHVPETADEFIEVVGEILRQQSDDGRAALRHAYALANTCHGISERILDLIEQSRAAIGPGAEPARDLGAAKTRRPTDAFSRTNRWQPASPGGKVMRIPAWQRRFSRRWLPALKAPHSPASNPMNLSIRAKLSVMMFLEYVI